MPSLLSFLQDTMDWPEARRMVNKVKIVKKEIAYRGPYVSVENHHFISKKGNNLVWQVVKRANSKKIVIVFALTKKKEVLLTKMFRIPQKSFVIEYPAGLTDRKGEAYPAAARRELLEETGYRAGRLIKIIEGPFNAGMSVDRAVVFFAPDVMYARKPLLDEAEEIDVIKVPIGKFVDFVMHPPKGCLVDIKMLGAVPILKKRKLI